MSFEQIPISQLTFFNFINNIYPHLFHKVPNLKSPHSRAVCCLSALFLNRHLFSRFALHAVVATHARRSEGAAPPEVCHLVCGEREAVERHQRCRPPSAMSASSSSSQSGILLSPLPLRIQGTYVPVFWLLAYVRMLCLSYTAQSAMSWYCVG